MHISSEQEPGELDVSYVWVTSEGVRAVAALRLRSILTQTRVAWPCWVPHSVSCRCVCVFSVRM